MENKPVVMPDVFVDNLIFFVVGVSLEPSDVPLVVTSLVRLSISCVVEVCSVVVLGVVTTAVLVVLEVVDVDSGRTAHDADGSSGIYKVK